MALRHGGPRARQRHDMFPGFTDVHEIGVGRLAVVFRARETGTNRQVALKLLNVRDASPRSIESFERESIALGALGSHPNIVTLYRTFRTPDGRPVLVLELCSGAVADLLHNGAGLPVPDVVSIGVKIAGALETAHRGGILHRDVKPQNILLTEFGEPALADFGVAMLQSSSQTTAGLFDFTTLHAAPELLEGGGTSAATDVYELASSLYQLIAGHSAFRAYDGESPASVILRILRDPVRPLSATDVPMALSDLLLRAMSKEKDERPPTAAEFAAELAEIEIRQNWNRTQFLIRDPGPLGSGEAPEITRRPDDVPRGLPSTLAPSITVLTPVGSGTETAAAPSAAMGGWTPADPLPTAQAFAPIAGYAPRHRPDGAAAPQHLPGVAVEVEAVAPAEPAAADNAALALAAELAAPTLAAEFAAPTLAADYAAPTPGAANRAEPTEVPVWAVRSAPGAEPRFVSDLSLDPMSLRRRATVRAGASSITVDEHRLRMRTWLTRTEVAWPDVFGFQVSLDPAASGPSTSGHIVALTSGGPIELAGTRRTPTELGYVHALLSAYRTRAQRIAAR